jgi:hypothetical protein
MEYSGVENEEVYLPGTAWPSGASFSVDPRFLPPRGQTLWFVSDILQTSPPKSFQRIEQITNLKTDTISLVFKKLS